MSPVATQRPATRDERPYSLFSFSPERVLGLKRAAEVRRRPSPGIPPASVSETIPPTPPVADASTPSPRSSPQPFRAAEDGGEQRLAKTPRTARKTVRARRDRLRGRIRAWRRALARVDSPRLATDPRHRDPPLPSAPAPPQRPSSGEEDDEEVRPARRARASRAPFPARPRWIRDVARLSSRRRAPRSRADPRPRAHPAPRFPIRDRRRRGIR